MPKFRDTTFLVLLVLAIILPLGIYFAIEHVPIMGRNYLRVENVLVFKSYNITLVLDENGSITITEVFSMRFPSMYFKEGLRVLPYWSIDYIEMIGMYELWNGSWIEYNKRLFEGGRYRVDMSVDRYIIRWTFYTSKIFEFPQNRTLMIKYKVVTPLETNEAKNTNYFLWRCIPQRNARIEKANVKIVLPFMINESELNIDPKPDKIEYVNKSTIIYYKRQDIGSNEYLDVRVEFPKRIELPLYVRKYLNTHMGAVVAFFLAFTSLMILMTYLAYGFRLPRRIPTKPIFMQAGKLDPTSLRYIRKPFDIISWLLTLIISLASKRIVKLIQSDEEVYVVPEKVSGLVEMFPWEKEAYQLIPKEETKLSEIFTIFGEKGTQSIEESLLDYLYTENIVDKNFKKKVSSMMATLRGIVILFLIMGLIFLAIGGLLISLPLILGGLITLFGGIIGISSIKGKLSPGGIKSEEDYGLAIGHTLKIKESLRMATKRLPPGAAIIRIREILNNGLPWLVALDGIKTFRYLGKIEEKMLEKGRGEINVKDMYPDWITIENTKKFVSYLNNLGVYYSAPKFQRFPEEAIEESH